MPSELGLSQYSLPLTAQTGMNQSLAQMGMNRGSGRASIQIRDGLQAGSGAKRGRSLLYYILDSAYPIRKPEVATATQRKQLCVLEICSTSLTPAA